MCRSTPRPGLIGNCRLLYLLAAGAEDWGGRKQVIAWNTFEVPISRLATDRTALPGLIPTNCHWPAILCFVLVVVVSLLSGDKCLAYLGFSENGVIRWWEGLEFNAIGKHLQVFPQHAFPFHVSYFTFSYFSACNIFSDMFFPMYYARYLLNSIIFNKSRILLCVRYPTLYLLFPTFQIKLPIFLNSFPMYYTQKRHIFQMN